MPRFQVRWSAAVDELGVEQATWFARLVQYLENHPKTFADGATKLPPLDDILPDAPAAGGRCNERLIRKLDETTRNTLLTLRFRYAPSIITRSEAEVMGLADPRFALRATLADEAGIINLRRVAMLCRRLKDVHFTPGEMDPRTPYSWPGSKYQWRVQTRTSSTSEASTEPAQVVARNPAIADAILRAPARLRTTYHLVERSFGGAYSEDGALLGTPYVRHIHLQGGGLCAQASAFLSAVLLNEFIRPESSPDGCGIHAIADITGICNGDDHSARLRLSGLANWQIAQYLSRLGLSSQLQVHEIDEDNAVRGAFPAALRAYARSGFPSIVGVRILECPWIRNRTDTPPPVTLSAQKLNHVVVVVGTGREDSDARGRLLIHDTATYPFIECDADALWSAAKRVCTRDIADEEITSIESFLIPAVPGPVTIALISSRLPGSPSSTSTEEDRLDDEIARLSEMTTSHIAPDSRNKTAVQHVPGLFDVARFVQSKWPGEVSPGDGFLPRDYLCDAQSPVGEFQLLQFGQINDRFGPDAIRIGSPATATTLIELNRELRPGWYWVQYREMPTPDKHAVLWIWDAESRSQLDPDILVGRYFKERLFERPLATIVPLIVATYIVQPAGVHLYWKNPEFMVRQNSPVVIQRQDTPLRVPSPRRRELLPALITSYTLSPSRHALSCWPEGVGVDLYCFMHREAAIRHHAQHHDAVSFLAHLDDSRRRELARQITESLPRQADGSAASLVALSTYIPQLGGPGYDQSLYLDGKAALISLIQLVRLLRNEHGCEDLKAIEVVAGSRTLGLGHGKRVPPTSVPTAIPTQDDDNDDETNDYFVHLRSRSDAINKFARTLADVRDTTDFSRERDAFAIAVELEHGPLQTVNSLDALSDLFESLRRIDPALLSVIGCNLDMAHWHLAGQTPEGLRKLLAVHAPGASAARAPTTQQAAPHRYAGVVRQIVHAHISDHAKGHFGDVPVGVLGFEAERYASPDSKLDVFRRWLDLLADVWKGGLIGEAGSDGVEPPVNTGRVSVELEACRGIDAMRQSVSAVRGLIGE